MNRILAFIPIIALIVIAAIGGFMLLRNDGAPREKFAAGMVGQMAPTYALQALDGEGMVTSDAVRGRPHLIIGGPNIAQVDGFAVASRA